MRARLAVTLDADAPVVEASRCVVAYEGRPICTIELDTAPDGARIPVVNLVAGAGLRLRLPSFEVQVGRSRLRVTEDGVALSTPGVVSVEGRDRIELWGGPGDDDAEER